jgi:hypothetical protein
MAVFCSTPFNFNEFETIKKNNDTVGIVGINDSTPTVIFWKKKRENENVGANSYTHLFQITRAASSVGSAASSDDASVAAAASIAASGNNDNDSSAASSDDASVAAAASIAASGNNASSIATGSDDNASSAASIGSASGTDSNITYDDDFESDNNNDGSDDKINENPDTSKDAKLAAEDNHDISKDEEFAAELAAKLAAEYNHDTSNDEEIARNIASSDDNDVRVENENDTNNAITFAADFNFNDKFVGNGTNGTNGKHYEIPMVQRSVKSFVNTSKDGRKQFIKTYFVNNTEYYANPAMIQYIMEMKMILTEYFKALYIKKNDQQEINELDAIVYNHVVPGNMKTGYRMVYNIDIQRDIFGKLYDHAKPLSKEELASRTDEWNKELEDICKKTSLPIVNDDATTNAIQGISEEIKTAGNSGVQINRTNFYQVETTAEGECMYSSFIFSMIYKGIGTTDGTGWIPMRKQLKDSKKINYMGNLREVLAAYICNNWEYLINANVFSLSDILECLNRVKSNRWGEDTEIKILARMFNVCVGIFKQIGPDIGDTPNEVYNNEGKSETNDIGQVTVPNACNDKIIYLLHMSTVGDRGGYHYRSVINKDTQGNGGSSTRKRRGGRASVRKPSTKKRGHSNASKPRRKSSTRKRR